jgi:hypothetical protein
VSHQVPRRPRPRRPRRPIMTRRRESGASLPGSRMAAVPDRVDVVLVADVGDPHQLCVDAQLQALGARTLRLNLSVLVSRTLVSRIGALDVAEGTNWSRVDHATTVWWFRPGQAHVEEGTMAPIPQLERRLPTTSVIGLKRQPVPGRKRADGRSSTSLPKNEPPPTMG